jgi:uncharacterized membrane protein YfhO
MKKKLERQDLIALLIYTVTFLFIFFLITKEKNYFGSTTDFDSQHYLIPEYFRMLFYHTHDLLPDFALNLGGGINIYYLSYYGFLSPLILLSYLMPHVQMLYYIIISTSIVTILASFLFYFFLKKHNYNYYLCLLGGYLFILATPLIFHAHRHIMFINYMVFLIIGLFGVDHYFTKKKISLLVISLFLIIMTSYYYSVGSIFVLFIYGIYKYLSINKKFKFKLFIKEMLKFIIPFIIAIMMGMVILLPTIYVILSSRAASAPTINLLSILLPNLSFKYTLYNPYGPGLSLICIIASLYLAKNGKKEDKFLSLVILLISVFPIFNYILNGTLYIDSKSLIPFLPLILLVTIKFLSLFFANKISQEKLCKTIIFIILLSILQIIINLLFFNTNGGLIVKLDTYSYSILIIIEAITILLIIKNYNSKALYYYLIIAPLVFSLLVNANDKLILIKKDHYESLLTNTIKDIVNNDKGFYRVNNNLPLTDSYNKIEDIREYQSSIYSSTNNKYFNQIYYNTFNNNVVHRNRAMVSSSTNPLYNIFMGEKYIITKRELNFPVFDRNNKFTTYINDYAFPIGYVNDNILNINDYNKQNYVTKELSNIKYAVTNDKTNVDISSTNLINLTYEKIYQKHLDIIKEGDKYHITSNNGDLILKIDDKYKDGILFIDFKNYHNPSCAYQDLAIKINYQKNKLTCSTWKYHNQNYDFHYSLSGSDTLKIHFNKGTYLLGDFNVYFVPYSELKNIKNNLDTFNPTKIDGDYINGDINVTKDGYFIMQIPYDKGFKIKVDNKIVKYMDINNGILGFKIKKGYHKINIEYIAPYKNISLKISLIGFIILLIYIIMEKVFKYRKYFKK